MKRVIAEHLTLLGATCFFAAFKLDWQYTTGVTKLFGYDRDATGAARSMYEALGRIGDVTDSAIQSRSTLDDKAALAMVLEIVRNVN